MRFRRLAAGVALTGVGLVGTAGAAFAHDCYNTQRSGTGGTVGTYDVATDAFTPSGQKGNPAFVRIVFPDGSAGYLFIHSASEVNDYVVPGAKDCDQKGLDNFEACFG
ncbi:MAG TPA: hypothetical protein VMZ73_10485 [Acidimicrobiales bacterium]|nr:hypothetical protein [Acidimicrobiales bacterium]